MQAKAEEIARLRRQFFCILKRNISKTGCIQIQTSTLAIKQMRKRPFNSPLTRIGRADFSKLMIYAG
jgi:hypothetical protein